jgi:predicted nuclease of predicted toxin-antitoxin system
MPVFLLDENVHKPDTIIDRCAQVGVEVLRVHQLSLNQADDPLIFEHALAAGYVLVTGNLKDFRPLVARWIERGNDFPGAIWLQTNKYRDVEAIIRKIIEVAEVYDKDLVKEWWLD